MRSPIPWIALVLAAGVILFILYGPRNSRTVTLTSTPAVSSDVDASAPATAGKERTFEIVTLLPKDAIPAVYDPQFNDVEDANREYADADLVIGVEIGDEARAYSIPFLSGHEIVDDSVGGRAIAVTW